MPGCSGRARVTRLPDVQSWVRAARRNRAPRQTLDASPDALPAAADADNCAQLLKRDGLSSERLACHARVGTLSKSYMPRGVFQSVLIKLKVNDRWDLWGRNPCRRGSGLELRPPHGGNPCIGRAQVAKEVAAKATRAVAASSASGRRSAAVHAARPGWATPSRIPASRRPIPD